MSLLNTPLKLLLENKLLDLPQTGALRSCGCLVWEARWESQHCYWAEVWALASCTELQLTVSQWDTFSNLRTHSTTWVWILNHIPTSVYSVDKGFHHNYLDEHVFTDKNETLTKYKWNHDNDNVNWNKKETIMWVRGNARELCAACESFCKFIICSLSRNIRLLWLTLCPSVVGRTLTFFCFVTTQQSPISFPPFLFIIWTSINTLTKFI